MDGMDKHVEQKKEIKKRSRTDGYLVRMAENKLPDPPDSAREKIFDELGVNVNQETEIPGHNRRAGDKADYSRLIQIMEDNQSLLMHICSHTGLKKEEIIGAAILHFSTLPIQKQLGIVTEYRK